MMDRDRRRSHARETPRARRIRLAEERDAALRAKGIDPDIRARSRFEGSSSGSPSSVASSAPQRPRKPISIGRLLRRTAVVTVLLLIVGAVLLGQRMAAFNASVSSASALSSSLLGPLMGSDRLNVALYGYGGPEHTGGSYLADSINILSINPADNSTTLIPIPRDLWIAALPDLPHGGKVNEVFADGYLRGGIPEAGRLTTSLLAAVTGLKIDHWMAIDFVGFRGMVDAVGGVTLDNPRAFSMAWSDAKYRAGIFDGGTFPAGPLTMDGQQALAYARARYTDNAAESSDFARSVRQQVVLSAMRSKLGGGGIGSLGPGLALMDALKDRMQTDLSAFDLFLLSGHLSIAHRLELTEDVILQAARNSAGQYILAVIGRASEDDYAPLDEFIRAGLAAIVAAEPSANAS